DNESSMFSSLLLTSELKGRIERPNYYFNTANERANTDLDILMLAQGYRRFEWKQILTGNIPPASYRPEASLQISGSIKTLSGKPVAKSKVSLLSSSKGFFMLDTLSNDKGNFVFSNLQFKDSTKFVVQSKTTKDKKNIKIEIDSAVAAPVIPAKYLSAPNNNLKDSLSVYLANSKKSYNEQMKYGQGNHSVGLNEVKIVAWKPKLENSGNLNGPGAADQVLLWKDIHGGCGDIASCLMGRVNKMFIKWDPNKMCYEPVAYRNGKEYKLKIKVDGVDMEAEMLATLSPQGVESVEVLMSPQYTSVYGSDGYNGVLLINMKKGVDAIPLTNIAAITPKGYYKAREFYSPEYDNPKTNTQMPDLRTTIYWNPNVVTGKNGKASFEYFNADSKGTYRVIVEGIDGSGKLGRAIYRYTVN
ncbi:MAG TPA: TonB-dependent receptor, partial [Mucilaginibacter sp.]|nr:TonB-dependent receptor [Mucilaginibacter sp.]